MAIQVVGSFAQSKEAVIVYLAVYSVFVPIFQIHHLTLAMLMLTCVQMALFVTYGVGRKGHNCRSLPLTADHSNCRSQHPVRPPTAPEARPLAQGGPLGPRGGEPSPLGYRRGATLHDLLKVRALSLLPP